MKAKACQVTDIENNEPETIIKHIFAYDFLQKETSVIQG